MFCARATRESTSRMMSLLATRPSVRTLFPRTVASLGEHHFSPTTATNARASRSAYVGSSRLRQQYFSFSSSSSTATPFLLADIGEGIKEVELMQWYVEVGQEIRQFDTVAQVQSDKATVDISSRFDGVVDSLAGHAIGDMVQVGSPLLYIREEGESTTTTSTGMTTSQDPNPPEDSPAVNIAGEKPEKPTKLSSLADDEENTPAAAERTPESVVDEQPRSTNSTTRVWTSPAVRRLCQEHSIDPQAVTGTGPQGRILKSDVLAYMEESEDASDTKIIQLKGYTRLMAQTMAESLTIPHMGLSDELEVTELLALRKKLSESDNMTISLLAFLLKACSVALSDYPLMNAAQHSVENVEVKMQDFHHLGVAMDTPRGLVVPVIQNCQDLSILELQHELNRLKGDAIRGAVSAADVAVPPTFTLSNIGALGAGLAMKPVLAPPQLAMGAMGRLCRVPRFDENNAVVAVDVLPVSWAGDHRFLDGATMARFHTRLQELVRDPVQLLVRLR